VLKSRQAIVLLLCLGALSYFVNQAVLQRHGLETKPKLVERSVALGQELVRLEAVRASLERETGRLAADPPDLDLLDEHARRVLGFVRPGDLMILPPAR
jgi:cell division protein FtsB